MPPELAIELHDPALGVVAGPNHAEARQAGLDLERFGFVPGQGAGLHVHAVAGHGDVVGALQDAGERLVQGIVDQLSREPESMSLVDAPNQIKRSSP